MANLAPSRPRPRPQENEDFLLSHLKSTSHSAGTVVKSEVASPERRPCPAVGEPPEPPPTRLDLRDALVKMKGGGYPIQEKGWFENVDENGYFHRKPYNNGLTFVMGFHCTWLELEKIEDFVVKELFIPTGRNLLGGGVERLLHLELDKNKSDTTMRLSYIIGEIQKRFPFTTTDTIPRHFRAFQIWKLIQTASRHIQTVVDSALSASGSSSSLPVQVSSDIYFDHSNFRRPRGASPKPDKNSKYELSDCRFVVTKTTRSEGKVEIPLIDLLDKPAGSEVHVINKNINFGHFMKALEEHMGFARDVHDACRRLEFAPDEHILRPIRSKGDLIATIKELHVPASMEMPLLMVSLYYLSSCS